MAIGVYHNKKTGKYLAHVTHDKKRIHVGTFDEECDAVSARHAKCAELGIDPLRTRGRPKGSSDALQKQLDDALHTINAHEHKLSYLYRKIGALQTKVYQLLEQ